MKTITLYIIFLFFTIPLFAQADTTYLKIDSSKLVFDQTLKSQIGVILKIDLDTRSLDPDFFVTNKPVLKAIYKGIKQKKVSVDSVSFAVHQDPVTHKLNSVGFEVNDLSADFINYFLITGDSSITIAFTSDLKLRLSNGEIAYIKHQELNNALSNLSITKEDREKLLLNPLGYYYYEEKFDFGVQPKGDGNNKTNFFITIKKTSAYPNTKSENILFWTIDTRLSTNFKDSLNFIKYYPLNLTFRSRDFSKELVIKLGSESDQGFFNKRVAADASGSFMPSFINIDFTNNSPRIRPKPIIGVGAKYYYDYSKANNGFSSGLAYLNGHYYIPIIDNYSLIIDGEVFYDFSKENNPSKKVMSNYSIIFGVNLPKTPFTALFKYIDGETDINYEQGQLIGLGLLMNFIKK